MGTLRTLAVGVCLGATAIAATTAPAYAERGTTPVRPAGSAVASPAVATAEGARAASAAAVTYWTPERMRQAIPITPAVDAAEAARLNEAVTADAAKPAGPAGRTAPSVPTQVLATTEDVTPLFGATAAPWYGSVTSPPATTTGRVFFTGDDGLGYSCSGSAVNSNSKRLVWTAGHCVHGGGAGRNWFTNWVFVPRYNNGNAPYGVWASCQLWSWTLWTNNGDRRYDFGASVTCLNGAGQRIVNVVGGQGIEWNWPLVQFHYQFGYPAGAPFNGQTLQYCTGTSFNDGGNQGINCNMTGGASGGPWLDDFDQTFGWLNSVNSWMFWTTGGPVFKWNGPYFGEPTRILFETIQNL